MQSLLEDGKGKEMDFSLRPPEKTPPLILTVMRPTSPSLWYFVTAVIDN